MSKQWAAYYARKPERGIERARAMWELYKSGLTWAQVGQQYGITGDAVAKAVWRYVLGVQP